MLCCLRHSSCAQANDTMYKWPIRRVCAHWWFADRSMRSSDESYLSAKCENFSFLGLFDVHSDSDRPIFRWELRPSLDACVACDKWSLASHKSHSWLLLSIRVSQLILNLLDICRQNKWAMPTTQPCSASFVSCESIPGITWSHGTTICPMRSTSCGKAFCRPKQRNPTLVITISAHSTCDNSFSHTNVKHWQTLAFSQLSQTLVSLCI